MLRTSHLWSLDALTPHRSVVDQNQALQVTAISSLLVGPGATRGHPHNPGTNGYLTTSACTEGRGLEPPSEKAQSAPPFFLSLEHDIQCVKHSGYIERFVIISPSDYPLSHKASGGPPHLSIPRRCLNLPQAIALCILSGSIHGLVPPTWTVSLSIAVVGVAGIQCTMHK